MFSDASVHLCDQLTKLWVQFAYSADYPNNIFIFMYGHSTSWHIYML